MMQLSPFTLKYSKIGVGTRGAIAAASLVITLSACSASAPGVSGGTSSPPSATQADSTKTPRKGSSSLALTALDSLAAKGRAPKTGYDRNAFGSAWVDVDGNGCDTRNDMLIRDLVERQMQDSCIVLSGVLYPDPYTATNITFVRGKSMVDIDHVVALGNAWVTGAFGWDSSKKLQFANDPLNLLAVSASANRQKSDADAATWLPSNKAYRCDYVARQIAVKSKYSLWATSAEKEAMRGALASCPNQELPTNASLPMPVPTSPGSASPGDTDGSEVTPQRYRSCDQARQAEVTPITKRTNPILYKANSHLDRDGDGVACE